MTAQREIDTLLRQAVETGAVPGVVAMATDRTGILCQSAHGLKRADSKEAITPDTVFWYASMTKALVATAAMQLVEQGRIQLDEPISNHIASLGSLQVLEGYDEAGKPRLRPAKHAMTLRHLLTHTSGFGYDIWNASVLRYMEENGLPSLMESRKKSLIQPLVADPGERWEYGISLDWVGQTVEAVSGQSLEDYLGEHLFKPLGMVDTGFIIRNALRPRQASIHRRQEDGSFSPIVHEVSQEPEFYMGGGGLYGTVSDYIAFVQMMLNDGKAKSGVQVLRPETVAEMARNNIGELKAGVLDAVLTHMSYPSNFFPGMDQKWGLSFLINPEKSENGRSAGSLTWAGLANTYFWIDREKGIGGVLATQILPFADPQVLALFGAFERAVYRDLATRQAA